MRKAVIIGYTISYIGVVLLIYGYFAIGKPSLIDWHAITPLWIADFLPDIQSEIGMVLAFTYWPSRSQ